MKAKKGPQKLVMISPKLFIYKYHLAAQTSPGLIFQIINTLLMFIGTAIPRDTLPLDMLTPQIRHYELRQKNSRYANFSDLSTPSYAIF